jgi:hypothetical protein
MPSRGYHRSPGGRNDIKLSDYLRVLQFFSQNSRISSNFSEIFSNYLIEVHKAIAAG